MEATLKPLEAFHVNVNGIDCPNMIVTSTWMCFKLLENGAGDQVITFHPPGMAETFRHFLGAATEATIIVTSHGLSERAGLVKIPSQKQLATTLAKVLSGAKPGDAGPARPGGKVWDEQDYLAAEFATGRPMERPPKPEPAVTKESP